MLDIYRIDHLAHAVPDLASQLAMLEGLFGFRRLKTYEHREAGVQGARLGVPGTHGQVWELVAPLGDSSALKPFLDSPRGPGLLHVGAEVPDMEAAVAELGRRGLAFTGDIARWVDASLSPPATGPGVTWRLWGPGGRGSWGDLPGATETTLPAAGGDAPTLGIVGIDHVCQGYRNRDELAGFLQDLLGFRQVWRTPEDEHEDMADLVMNVPGSSLCWEIIMPRGEGSFIDKFLDGRGPAAHHVTFEVADWDRAMAACKHHDVKTFGANAGETDGGSWNDVFIHPKLTGGVLVQLFCESRPGVWVRSDKTPPRQG
jgi:catechol 2,3-dioxygenase-like lactoylglutathione lyase family enzyme